MPIEILQIKPSEDKPQTSPFFYDEKDPLSKDEGSLAWLARQGIRGTARGVESLAGLPGDILGGIQSLASTGIEKITGGPSRIRDIKVAPTSEDIRQYVTQPIAEKILPEGYIEPQTSSERFVDDLVGDFAAFIMPIKGKIPFSKAFAAAFLGNAGKKVAEEMGASPLKQVAAKSVGMVLPFFLGPKSLIKEASKMYAKADSVLKKLPRNVPVSTQTLKPIVSNIKKFIRSGVTTPGKEVLKPIIQKLERATAGKKTNLKNLWATYKDINNNFRKYSNLPDVAANLPKINAAIRETILKSKKLYPDFSDVALNAINMWHGIHNASRIRTFLRKVGDPKALQSQTAKFLLALHPFETIKHWATVYPVHKIQDTLETLFKSKSAQKLYAKTLSAAPARNASLTLKSISQLDNELVKIEGNGKIGFEILEISPL